MNKKLVFKVLLGLFIVLLLFNISLIDYSNLNSEKNIPPYLGGAANILFIVTMAIFIRGMNKKEKK
ncbi:hypothetical protein [Patiriisocius hiemis]|uniref:Uncharacterized protein n=1 Tax=Patiriisocius hiemis TaxID=3075604 RepID=A0ABU2YEJ7_9FLAO|nr:hypothetical protein [Constantimarinum sp. W242]MDT0556286.1 hypothetical protein [Constantimarinum sp. W242]